MGWGGLLEGATVKGGGLLLPAASGLGTDGVGAGDDAVLFSSAFAEGLGEGLGEEARNGRGGKGFAVNLKERAAREGLGSELAFAFAFAFGDRFGVLFFGVGGVGGGGGEGIIFAYSAGGGISS